MAIPLPLPHDDSLLAQAAEYAAKFHQLGMSAEAEKLCTGILEVRSDHFDALRLLGVLRQQQGDNAEAMRLIGAALRLNPRSVEALESFAGVLYTLGRYEEALAACDDALRIEPDHLEVLGNRGHALLALARYEDALRSYDRALDVAPGHMSALNKYGNSLLLLRRNKEALAVFDQALALATKHSEVLRRRTAALRALRRESEAAESNRADTATSHRAETLFNRGTALLALGHTEEAVESYQEARALDHPGAVSMLAYCSLAIADWAEAAKHADALKRRIAEGAFVDPLMSIAFGFDPSVQLKTARSAARILVPVRPKPFVHSTAGQPDRLRIAYLSSDFRQHPVGFAIAELLERHDRSRFEVIGVSYGPDDASDVRARIAHACDRFHDVATDADATIAGLLHDLRVNIVVDLNGPTAGYRPGILASRPVPIQASYLGYAGTTGTDFTDYLLADETVLPFDQQPFFSESIAYLPDCYFANDATRRPAPEIPGRSKLGLPDRGLVFCCFNKSYKIAAPMFDLWMRLLARLQDSVLWLSEMNELAAANLCRAAAARGVDPARLIFAPRMDRMEDHLARHGAADLFLDTLPYNAHSTACDALWAGLPVLTCAGSAFAGRVGASMLKAAGLSELVTHGLADYEAMALRLAADPALLSSIRRKLADNRTTCALFDSDRFRRHLEAAYATMWDIYRRGERPHTFHVEPGER